MPKIDKAEAHYGIGHQTSHCGKSFADDTGYCRHFITPQSPESQVGTCQRVSGAVNRVYRCRFWVQAQSK